MTREGKEARGLVCIKALVCTFLQARPINPVPNLSIYLLKR